MQLSIGISCDTFRHPVTALGAETGDDLHELSHQVWQVSQIMHFGFATPRVQTDEELVVGVHNIVEEVYELTRSVSPHDRDLDGVE